MPYNGRDTMSIPESNRSDQQRSEERFAQCYTLAVVTFWETVKSFLLDSYGLHFPVWPDYCITLRCLLA